MSTSDRPTIPVSLREATRAEALGYAGSLLGGAVLAGVLTAVDALTAPVGRADSAFFVPAWVACSLALLAWALGTSRILMVGRPDVRAVSLYRAIELYRGSLLVLPGISVVTAGALLVDRWRPAGLAVAAAGALLMLAGLVVGAVGRPERFLPPPARGGLAKVDYARRRDEHPDLDDGFVQHVVRLRRARARLFGGDPARPLVAPSGP